MTRAIGLYVHVPFCAARCPYCDFATAPARSPLRAAYLDALASEIAREGAALGRPRVRTVYVGGGTPSLLEPGEVARLAVAIEGAFDVRAREVTVEANPATLDRARIDAWRAFGVTRLSLGAQSMSRDGLRALGRTHQVRDVAAAADAARSVGWDVNLDLIFGWPGQDERAWRADLEAALALSPDHLSCYPLELHLEPEAAAANWPGGWAGVGRWRRAAAARQPDDGGVAALYEAASAVLGERGYRHYEIANWALPGKRCVHNLGYWLNEEWLGVGAGAHSHLGGTRWANTPSLREYVAGAGRTRDDAADDPTDTAIVALRLDSGIDLDRYARRFGSEAGRRVARALAAADPSLVAREGARVRLTERGRLLANEVFVALLPG